MGCYLEHLSDEYPQGMPIQRSGSQSAVLDVILYNREELAQKLALDDISCVSDEELLMRIIREQGYEALAEVNGDFAGAIYDNENKTWTMFRNHMGVRPLFYYMDEDTFAFSTDMRGIAAMPEADLSINEKDFYLRMMGCSTLSACETDYQNIRCVRPACWMVVRQTEQGFSVEEHPYWKLNAKPVRMKNDRAYQEELRRLVTDSVRRRLNAVSGPVGGELSGGLDSSVIAILMNRLGRKGEFFSWSYPPEELPLVEDDERKIVLDICEQEGFHCQFSHYEKDEHTFRISDLTKEIWPPYINTTNISEGSRCLADKGVRAVFTGHGGDEGISHRCNLLELWKHGEYLSFLRAFYHRTEGQNLRILRTLRRAQRQLTEVHPRLLQPFRKTINAEAYLNDDFCERMKDTPQPQLSFAYDVVEYIGSGGSRNRMDNVAVQGAVNGVRYMLPFLDYRVIDFAVSIPRSQYHNGVENRWIYRRAFDDLMPQSLREVHRKDTASLKALPKKKNEREWFNQTVEDLASMLDENYWAGYMKLDKIGKLRLQEGYTTEELERAEMEMNEIFTCLITQNMALESAKRAEEN